MTVRANVPYLKTHKGAAPGAGLEFSISAPGQGLWRLISMSFSLVSDATVSNRTVALTLDDGTDIFWRSCASVVQTASVTWDYGVFAGAGNSDNTGFQNYFPLPVSGLWMQPGWRLRSATNNLQAGDAYTLQALLVEEFPNGPNTEWQPTIPRAEYERS